MNNLFPVPLNVVSLSTAHGRTPGRVSFTWDWIPGRDNCVTATTLMTPERSLGLDSAPVGRPLPAVEELLDRSSDSPLADPENSGDAGESHPLLTHLDGGRRAFRIERFRAPTDAPTRPGCS